jgi:4-hydroxy 2-oxovalerate aldolase|tara:strand:- start:1169 stop:2692 length:1524 start_codon:yes stop_codon:yes gene_type:complete
MKILDCTLRDGGYYTNWDFDQELTNNYYKLIKSLPIDILEIGYRGNSSKKNTYYGEYYFLTVSNLKKIKSIIGNKKKISIMIDLKDWNKPSELQKNLSKCKGIVDMVRFAINPKKIIKTKNFLKVTKSLGFKVCVNLMYSHLILNNSNLAKQVLKLKKYFNILYIVDSYGTLVTEDIKSIIKKIRDIDNKIQLGFHAHNNLEMALSNSIEAIKNNIDYLDCTITGMGRGAGNLKTELLLTYLNLKKKIMKINNYKNIANVVSQFEEMKLKEQWGASLPYMISGSTQSPQAEAMRLIKSKRYNLSDIITYLAKKEKRNIVIKKILSFKKNTILVVGGGGSVKKNFSYIKEFLKKNPTTYIIFAGSRSFNLFNNIKNQSILCITGNEINKISKKYLITQKFLINNVVDDKTILPKNLKNFFRLKKNKVDKKLSNSLLAISLSAALELKGKNIFLIGFDGYGQTNKINDYSLHNENQKIINFYRKKLNLISLTNTIYENIKKSSIFQYLN